LGNLYFKKRDNIKAYELFQKALKLSEQTKLQELTANINNKIGYIHSFIMNDPKGAKPYFERSYELHKQSGDKRAIAKAAVNLASVYSKLNDKKIAIDQNLMAYKIFSELKDNDGMAIASGNLGDYYTDLKQYDKAVKFIKLSEELHERNNSELGVNYNYLRLGTVYFKMNELQDAEVYLLKVFNYANTIGHIELIMKSSQNLNELYKIKKDPAKVMYFQNKYYISKDSINSSEKLAKIAEIATKNSLNRLEERKEMELQLNKIENEKDKQRKNYLIIGIGLILAIIVIFSLVIFKRLKITRQQNIIIQLQKKEVEEKNELIEEKQKEILDSIHYAKRIQTTLLAHKDFIDTHLEENFVLFKPKDIVSGDFYWATKKDHLFYLAVCDSTGHGVPGAFMSLLSISFLSEAINEKHILKPNEVFNYVRRKLIENISRDGQQDGFDGILICLDTLTKKVTYCAANNSPLLVSNGSYTELESDRMPVGKGIRNEDFREFTINYQKNDRLYLYTDGYADQFGGPKGKKFMYKKLNELLVNVCAKQLEQHCIELDQTLEKWRGNLEQVDDVCIIGLRL
jgi:serine phosphatase RsbU (regulator of sigma subunit)